MCAECFAVGRCVVIVAFSVFMMSCAAARQDAGSRELIMGGNEACEYRVVPINSGVCRVFETRRSDGGLRHLFRTVRDGEHASACGELHRCRTNGAPPAFACEPDMKEHWPYEEGRSYSALELRQLLAGAPESSRPPVHHTTQARGETCMLLISPPVYGACYVSGSRRSADGSEGEILGPYIPYGKSAMVCGEKLPCSCDFAGRP